ncbi:hypothetical protein [Desulfosporosinus sp. FKB]|uniref:hypothetical protein n=1 Tax=Desulfosporosinus sp. FKB TaxID=1969835 RepID=UPI001483591F|nr:hypothetical protein [Desulfosporosinus sp. FKB]
MFNFTVKYGILMALFTLAINIVFPVAYEHRIAIDLGTLIPGLISSIILPFLLWFSNNQRYFNLREKGRGKINCKSGKKEFTSKK